MDKKSQLKKTTWFLIGSVLVLFTLLSGAMMLNSNDREIAQTPELSREEMITRGEYLVNTSACNDCHTPKIMTSHGPEFDTTRLLSGHPASAPKPKVNKEALKDWVLFGQDLTSAAGPWGLSFAANLTSDETGVGNWTELQFITAIRKGKFKGLEGGRDLLPPMPWQVYRNMTDGDLKAIFAYLKSTKPVSNIVPAPVSPENIK